MIKFKFILLFCTFSFNIFSFQPYESKSDFSHLKHYKKDIDDFINHLKLEFINFESLKFEIHNMLIQKDFEELNSKERGHIKAYILKEIRKIQKKYSSIRQSLLLKRIIQYSR